MTKGTPSKGKRSGKKTHVRCRRCGKHTYHARKGYCASCGFGKTKKMRKYNWQNKRKGKRLK
ncbi:50S ribosomal protein L37e [Candidatus Woesearchaeota archaeon]|nr:50S ribosomal protein L37e [Candidatus Woesearchaeota archaeon]